MDKKDEWISSTIQSLKKASPTSLKISLRSVSQSIPCDTITLSPKLLYHSFFRLIRNWSCRMKYGKRYLAWFDIGRLIHIINRDVYCFNVVLLCYHSSIKDSRYYFQHNPRNCKYLCVLLLNFCA